MFDDLSDHVLRLRLRRARVYEAALALADRAARQHGRPFNTREQAQYEELTAALNRLDNRLRQLRLEARRADRPSADINAWCRDNDTGPSPPPRAAAADARWPRCADDLCRRRRRAPARARR